MQLALPQQAVSHSARLSGGRPAGLSRRPAIRLGNAARRSEAPSASAIRAVSSHAAPGPHSAALAPARAPVFQLSIAAAPAQPRPSLPPQSLAIGGIQIPNSLVYTLIGFLGAFWACFFCVLLALFPTLHEVRAHPFHRTALILPRQRARLIRAPPPAFAASFIGVA